MSYLVSALVIWAKCEANQSENRVKDTKKTKKRSKSPDHSLNIPWPALGPQDPH